jgi:hypothetical protein
MAAGSSHSGSQPAKLTLVRSFAMQINHTEWEELRTSGIVARARMKIDFSSTHRRFVLCAEESGGATDNIGHYCGFLPLSGDPTFFVRPVTLAMPNTVHADVSAASLVSIEMLRYGTTYTLNIFLHWLTASPGRDVLPAHRQKLIFSANRGVLSKPLWQDGKAAQVGAYLPAFHRRTGDPLLIPHALHEAVSALTDGVCCVGCRKSHLLALNPVRLPEELSAPIIHKPDPRVTVPRAAPAVTPRTAQAGKNKKKRDRRRAKQLLARQEAAKAALPKTPDAVADISEVPALQEVKP